MVLEWSISEDRIGRIGDVLGFMRVKSRYLEAFGVISVWNREFVLDTMASKESRDDPLSSIYSFIFTGSASRLQIRWYWRIH